MPRFRYDPTTPDAGSIADIIMRRGQIAGNRARTIADVEAQAAMARGQIWGGTVAGIAGSVGDLISGYARQKAEAPARVLEHATKTADLRLKETQIAEAGQKAKEREELSRQDRALLRLFGADQTQAEGLLEPGNIDLRAQPSVPNPDGGMSTVYSFSVNFDGKEYLLPRVTPDGRLLSEDDAISEFQQTGRHLGAFESPDHATKYASQLHEDYAAGRFNSQGPTPQDIIRVVGPQKGLAIIQGMKALADLQKGEVTDARDTAGRLALGLQQLSPALRKQAWPQIRELAIKAGLGDAETVPVEPSAEYLKAIVAWSTGKAPETPELMNVPPGGAVLDPTTREPVFTNPREVTPPAVGSFEDYVTRTYGPQPTTPQIAKARTDWAAMVREPETPGEQIPTPTARLNATRALRNDFVRETKAAAEVMRQFEQMQSSLSAVKQGSLAAGSQGVLVTFQKILDPTSVVRESEYARSASGLSLLNRLEGKWQTIVKGGAGVPVAELETFVKLAEQFSRNQAKYAKETKQQIESIASDFGLDPSHMTREFEPEADDAGATQKVGDTKTFPNGKKGRWDGTGWELVP